MSCCGSVTVSSLVRHRTVTADGTGPDPEPRNPHPVKTRRPAALALAALLLLAAGALSSCTPAAGAVAAAREQIGADYRSGGSSPSSGFDCSGLTTYAWKRSGVTLPRSSRDQYAWADKVTRAKLQPGDLVFYSSGGPTGTVSHVAIYAGDGKIVHATHPGEGVIESKLSVWWVENIVGYGRVPADEMP
jgi:cell wall-associated NlpC family hydrolase